MHLPSSLKLYKQEAERLYREGRAGELEFSEGTYQVFVRDEGEGNWTFLQLGPEGRLQDSFCDCEASEEERGCVHLAAAYLRIFDGSEKPLHERFSRSFWRALCRILADRLGERSDRLSEREEGRFQAEGLLIAAESREAKLQLRQILFDRPAQTEETSLKFSNLPEEEIRKWRKGQPGPELRFKLSFWNDLAKWLLFLQESGRSCQISFRYDDQGVPNGVEAAFPEISLEAALSREELAGLVPSLATVEAPLKVFTAEKRSIEEILYDQERGRLCIRRKEKKALPETEKGITFNGWLYIPESGFYPVAPHPLLGERELAGGKIAELFDKHGEFVKPLLKNAALHRAPVEAQYALQFDEEWNLHIRAHLFSPGDMTQLFGHWAYVEGKGFYKVGGLLFFEAEKVVPFAEVADFVNLHKGWLNQQKGFETHVANVESKMAYRVTEDGRLLFFRRVELGSREARSQDFGLWVYVEGEGFYHKARSGAGLSIRPGLVIVPDQVSLFVRANRDELAHVPGFFSKKCPVAAAHLDFLIKSPTQLRLSPRYEMLPEYKDRKVRFYEEITHVEGEGFFELPPEMRLPENYRSPLLLEGERLAQFLLYGMREVKGFLGELSPKVTPPKRLFLEAEKIAEAPKKGRGVYAMKLLYSSEKGGAELELIWEALRNKERFLFTEAGLLDLFNARFQWLREIKKKQLDKRGNTLYLTAVEIFRLSAFERITLRKSRRSDYEESKRLLDELTGLKTLKEPDLSLYEGALWPYQQNGLKWLWFLYLHGMSGFLCDEMGLGKTHQAMALIAAISQMHRNTYGKKSDYFLIVCPTSVIYHWEEKLQEFLPGFKVCTYHGSKRSLKAFHQEYDILLTSYGILRNEIKLLSQVPFELAIYDEIQIAKNHRSRTHAALQKVKHSMALGLTGTPIENRLRELKALFDLVLPGYMPSENQFEEFFVWEIEKENNPARRELLARYIKPFLLRRKKADVLPDLPPKIEEVVHCDLTGEQRRLYNEVLNKSRRRLIRELRDEGNPVPYFHVFALLTNLKQICNHPAVYYKQPDNYLNFSSGKWELFLELLSEARGSRQKVVVFSQYLFMLDIFENYLNSEGVGYASIRGSTVDRASQLKRFKNSPDCEVFLASLTASGLGIDLSSGSVVIHYDRWWNAARENQATDRVHRIGQTRGVQVFKLVTKNSFEERIDQIISEKGKLMEEVVGTDDYQFVKEFDRKELIALLQLVPDEE